MNAISLTPAAKARPNGADPTNAIVPSNKDLRSIAIELIEPHSQPGGHRHLTDDEFAQAVHLVENLTKRRRIVPRRPTRAAADAVARFDGAPCAPGPILDPVFVGSQIVLKIERVVKLLRDSTLDA